MQKRSETKMAMCSKHGQVEFVREVNGRYRCKPCRNEAVSKRRRVVKCKLVNMLGGKCQICGYCRCQEALQFHHVDPSAKMFCISHNPCKAWARVVKEASQCVLLCANCHAEVENGIIDLPDDIRPQNLEIHHPDIHQGENGCNKCYTCNKPLQNQQKKFCSHVCYHVASRKVSRPSKEQLQRDISESNFLALGRKYGVSDNAIRKWAKGYGLL